MSALGVEEQRVWTIVAFTSPRAEWLGLGDGYRVEASFVVADLPSVLQVPASALFRDGARWAVYVIDAGRARVRLVQPGISNGLQTQVLAGLTAGERVLRHPDDRIHDGAR